MAQTFLEALLSAGIGLAADNLFRATLIIGLLVVVIRRWRLSNHLPYPPGPPPRFMIGNSFDMPLERPWLKYMDLGKQYNSDILYLQTPTDHIIVLNSLHVTRELLHNRSNIYSDRPDMPMLELMGWDFNVGLLGYSDTWRRSRKIFQEYFNRKASTQYHHVQTQKIRQLLNLLLESPENFIQHYRTASAAIIMSTIYGYDVAPVDDHFKNVAEAATNIAASPFLPWAIAINTFPIMRYLPANIFHRSAMRCKRLTTEMLDGPFSFVRESLLAGTSSPCLLGDLLQRNLANGTIEDDELGKRIAATAYGAGADTTVSALETFHLAMVTNPDIQKKAQLELDEVIGTHRLPDLSDRPRLPYLEAVYREVMRWKPVLPLGVFHSTTEDDIYEGYLIPKGSVIFSNIWAMTHDERKYAEPDKFLPERFLGPDGKLNDDDQILAFGFGRRACVGRHMASATVWLAIAMTLATFKISKAKDEDGKEVSIREELTAASAIHYRPYLCSILPRDENSINLIKMAKMAA